MILEHKDIELFGKPIFSWVVLTTPNETDVPLPSEACVAYISEGNGQSLFVQEGVDATPGNVIVSVCGRTVGHMIAKQEPGKMSAIIAHFHQEQLQKIYKNSKPKLWNELEKPVTKFTVQQAATNLIVGFFEGIGNIFKNQEAITEDILCLKVQELILLLLQSESSPEIQLIINSLFSDRIFTFKETVDAYLFTPLSIQSLAVLTNKSLSSFKREFKRVYRTTPGAYIIDKRLERVAQLLSSSDDSITNIGYDCGFSSLEHLSRSFKSKYGVPPSKFRLDLTVKQ
ncbi:MAG: AraC family transcriptional regulator [Bacteroidota bacterium]